MYGRPVSVGSLYRYSVHTCDRAGDRPSSIYPLCTLHVVVTEAATLA